MHALRHELARRTIADDDKDASPYSLLKLSCAMASLLGIWESFVFAEALRDAADELEKFRARACSIAIIRTPSARWSVMRLALNGPPAAGDIT
jgi:hypothetical protein